jgi:hypothetical protein
MVQQAVLAQVQERVPERLVVPATVQKRVMVQQAVPLEVQD